MLYVCVCLPRMNLSLVKELGDRAAQGRAFGNLGNTHYLLGNFVEAIKFHREVSSSPEHLCSLAELHRTSIIQHYMSYCDVMSFCVFIVSQRLTSAFVNKLCIGTRILFFECALSCGGSPPIVHSKR